MAGALYKFPPRALSLAGAVLPGASLAFYVSGGLVPTPVYANGDLDRALGVTLRADSAGRFADFMLDPDVAYRAILTTFDGDEVVDLDPFTTLDSPQPDTPLDDAGRAMPLARLTFWLSHTTELAPIYSDSGLTTPADSEQVADSSGTFAPIYLNDAIVYRARLETADGVLVFDVDPVKIPAATPSGAGGLFILMGEGTYRVLAPPYTSAYISSSIDAGLGVFNGVTYGAGVIACYGGFNEGSSAGVRRSVDGGVTFEEDWSAPIYSNAPLPSRMAFGPFGPIVGLAQKFVHVGSRSNAAARAATSPDAPDDAFSWSVENDLIGVIGSTTGIAGVDCPGGQAGDVFFAYGNNGTIAFLYNDTSSWIPVVSGGPSSVYSHNSPTGVPYARFARSIAVSPSIVIGMALGRLVLSADGGVSWDLVSYNDCFHDANLIGGRGFNNPVRFGIVNREGTTHFVAVGSVAGAGLIRYADEVTFTDVPWPQATVPTTSPPISRIDNVVWDTVTSQYLALAFAAGEVDEEFGSAPVTLHVLGSSDGATWSVLYSELFPDSIPSLYGDFTLFPADLS